MPIIPEMEEIYARELPDHYQIQYIISSDRTMKSYNVPRSAMATDTNKRLIRYMLQEIFLVFIK